MNPRPPEPQSGALTNCAIPTVNVLEGIGAHPQGTHAEQARLSGAGRGAGRSLRVAVGQRPSPALASAGQGIGEPVHPEVKNPVNGRPMLWVGWDFIYSNDMGELIKKCEETFKEGAGE